MEGITRLRSFDESSGWRFYQCTHKTLHRYARIHSKQNGRSKACKLPRPGPHTQTTAANGQLPLPTRRQLQAQPGNSACGTASRRAGQQPRHVRIMSWNAGHLGQQQWGEIKTWLADEADQYCDVLILQETHWTATAEFTVSGWYCVSSASPPESCPKPKQGSRCKSRKDTQDGPSTTVADGVMVFYSKFDRQRIWWKEWLQGRVLEDITGK